MNYTDSVRLTTFRGVKNIHNLGRVISYNGQATINKWGDEECDQLRGTDGTIFPPFMKKEQGLWSLEPFLCRSLKAVYEKHTKYMGLPTLRYVFALGDDSVSPLLFRRRMDGVTN